MNINDLAYAYVQALPLNVISLKEIINWADSIIVKEDEPNIEVIELAGSTKGSETIAQLSLSSSSYDEEVSMRIFLWSAYETSLHGFEELTSYWDALDLANKGIYGNPEEIKENMLNHLDANRV
ncbi:hypothetical protein [Agaribacter marinus]|uniref:Uncharacterized protein n=1 Tax=Agaribacter marinus TaxID=1431249 RepID=A0AA37STH2_9ALTE|nr:hypothetical protein [Agaribacter marinus]GLR69133.1 hypothetical protein GCM10007852_00410 [Agaribacter marinus]